MATRRPLTDTQRNIRTAERAQSRLLRQQTKEKARQQADLQSGKIIGHAAGLSRSRLEHRERRTTTAMREQARAEGRIRLAQETEPIKTREYFKRHLGTRVATAAGSASKPVVNPIFLIIGTMAGLIIFYDVVTSAENVSGFFGSIQNGLSKLSTTSPLFVTSKKS